MNKRRKKSNQEKSNKNCRIIRCRYLTRPVFENNACQEFIKKINQEADNTCRNCKFSY
jgi:hypothetical protein